ncbi:MAG: sulfotransferase [Steroidobacteraceae bacterium]
MRLARPFFRLPVRFDIERLRAEVAALPDAAWVAHPNGIAGNSAARLISADGGENDDVDGIMQPTPHLVGSPYIRQVLASFGVVWSRSRLMRLAAHANVPEHADINHHWFYRVRLHIPVTTQPGVRFTCGDETVHMAAGEAWIFDNWRSHSVVNDSTHERIHLVADTTGDASFWQFVAQSTDATPVRDHRYEARLDEVMPMTERTRLDSVMHPAEVDLLLLDLRAELIAAADSADQAQQVLRYQVLLDSFRRDWRQLYTVHGEEESGWPQFMALRERLRGASRSLGEGLVMRTNRVSAHKVLEGRLLRAALPGLAVASAAAAASSAGRGLASSTRAGARPARLKQPIFIVAAPRSGSTLLFETLAASSQLVSLGGEAHWLVEDIEALRPGAPGVDSNRLTAVHASPDVTQRIVDTINSRLLDAEHRPVSFDPDLRLLEKTPKNALRIRFFDRIFPDARFIYLWRDPRENLSSIIEAWHSGRWKTYNGLPGFTGPWSLLLPPGWETMDGRPVEEIAAFQWEAANRIALEDLRRLPDERWMAVNYADLIRDPRASVERMFGFMGLTIDARLAQRIDHPLPLSRFTHTPPDPDKWQRNAARIERVMPALESLWRRLQTLDTTTPRAVSLRSGNRDAG